MSFTILLCLYKTQKREALNRPPAGTIDPKLTVTGGEKILAANEGACKRAINGANFATLKSIVKKKISRTSNAQSWGRCLAMDLFYQSGQALQDGSNSNCTTTEKYNNLTSCGDRIDSDNP